MRRALPVLAALSFASLLVATPAWADARAELEKARASYVSRNYPEAEERLRALLDQPKSGLKEAGLVSQARMVLGATLVAQGKTEASAELFEQLVLEDPTFEPDPLSYPSNAINAFIDIRSNLRDRIRMAAEAAARADAARRAQDDAARRAQEDWLTRIKLQAMDEKTTVRSSRLVASMPFGAGQFQNGEPVLGWIFLGAETSLTVATGITLPMYAYARSREREELASGDVERKAAVYHDRAENIRVTNLALVGGLALTAAVGIVQAHATFVPERVEHKKRDLPAVQPVVSVVPGGAYVGITGVSF